VDEQRAQHAAVALGALDGLAPIRMELVGFLGESLQDLLVAGVRRQLYRSISARNCGSSVSARNLSLSPTAGFFIGNVGFRRRLRAD
jgi:hypothetical protein